MKAVVVGLGQFGYATAVHLERSGVETIVFERELSLVERIKDEVSHSVCADATVPENLLAHGIGEADVLVSAIGDDFEAQVLVVVHAIRLGVARVVARATSDVHLRVLRAVGAHEVVSPESEAAGAIVQRLLMPEAGSRQLSPLLSTLEADLPEGVGGRLLCDHRDDLLQHYHVALFAVERASEKGSELLVDPGTRLEVGDLLHIAGSDSGLAHFLQGREGES